MTRLLFQLQLSNYDSSDRFILTGDSNWQLAMTKLPHMLRAAPNMNVDLLVPYAPSCVEDPVTLVDNNIPSDLRHRVNIIFTKIARNAVRTRYDFNWEDLEFALRPAAREYTHVYINDPMLLGNFKALFHTAWKMNPRFIVQTHFLDSPLNPVVPREVSYWHGQVEANLKADVCLWHCPAMKDVFLEAMRLDYRDHLVSDVENKSVIWKSGYSIDEIHRPVDRGALRFDPDKLRQKLTGKKLVWVPNRIGGMDRSFDYTNNGKFLLEIVPELWKRRQDFVVIAGNPNQKITNDELAERCPAYLKLVPGALNRDEYRHISSIADVVVGLYTNDTNGGLASLEAIEHGAIPLFPDVYEYKTYFDAVKWPLDFRVSPSLSDCDIVLDRLINALWLESLGHLPSDIRKFIREYAAYENTTTAVMEHFV